MAKKSYRGLLIIIALLLLVALAVSLILSFLGAQMEQTFQTVGNALGPAEQITEVPPPSLGGDSMAVLRYPAMEAPEAVLPEEAFTLLVRLAEDVQDAAPEIAAAPGIAVSEEGGLTLELPADEALWTFKVILHAPGFTLEDPASPVAEILLPRAGPSTPAVFVLRARPGAHPEGKGRLGVSLWRENVFIADLSREIAIQAPAVPEAGLLAMAPPSKGHVAPAIPVEEAGYKIPDLLIRVEYDDPFRLGKGQVILASPYFAQGILVGEIDTAPETVAWLQQQYSKIVQARRTELLVNAELGSEEAPMEIVAPMIAGFGRKLYDNLAPPLLRQVLEDLQSDPSVGLETIQIYSNNPAIPWELMAPPPPGAESRRDLLANRFLVARWHIGSGAFRLSRPRQEMVFAELAVVAPRYETAEALAYQESELAALKDRAQFRAVGGRLSDLRGLVERPPEGFVHFAGHGVVAGAELDALPVFSIRLEDTELDLLLWQGLVSERPQEGTFYFLNACEVGQAKYVANHVDGWAPAVLDSGAAGFIGALWPVFDESAARFAAEFYRQLESGLQEGPLRITDVLRALRREFSTSGDPTQLGYVYYGDVNLLLTRQ